MEKNNQFNEKTKARSPLANQILQMYQGMPVSRKILMGVAASIVLLGFAGMFIWTNKINYQTLYKGLSSEDLSAIVEKLNEEGVKYQIKGYGSIIKVPAEKLYDIRLSLAAMGLPKGGSIGYEFFNDANFGTTEFSRRTKYKKDMQIELSRTIKEFNEIEDARVMVVSPKDSAIIEDAMPPSASVLLKLKAEISMKKIRAIVHLVASALKDMSPERITVFDTKGRILSQAITEEEKLGEQPNEQLKYKISFEQNLAKRIQTMLERIVGNGGAIVRITADMDFDQVDVNEEIFDPDVKLIRSRQNQIESSSKTGVPAKILSGKTVPSKSGSAAIGKTEKLSKQDENVNYELNKLIRRTVKPIGVLERLSVAAVLDGTYVYETDESGNSIRKYVARSTEELNQFKKIVQKAMGYSEDREDQITVESFPFAHVDEFQPESFDWKLFLRQYGRSITNFFLVFLLFLFVVMPFLRTLKEIKTSVVKSIPLTDEKRKGLSGKDVEPDAISDLDQMQPKERSAHLAKQNVDTAVNVFRSWITEEKL